MLQPLLYCLVALFVLFALWYFISKLLPATLGQLLGVIAAIIFIIFACRQFGVHVPGM